MKGGEKITRFREAKSSQEYGWNDGLHNQPSADRKIVFPGLHLWRWTSMLRVRSRLNTKSMLHRVARSSFPFSSGCSGLPIDLPEQQALA